MCPVQLQIYAEYPDEEFTKNPQGVWTEPRTCFPQIYGVDEGGRAIMNRHLSRAKEFEFFEQLQPCMIGMDACSGAHNLEPLLVHLSGT